MGPRDARRTDCAEHREDRRSSSCLDRYTRHDVTALRVGGSSGRTEYLKEEVDELSDGESEEAGAYVVEHDAGAAGEALELADGRRL